MPRLMALDVGKARIGVAVSDAGGVLASPYTTLHVTRDETEIWTKLQQLVTETEAEALIVGLPISLDGTLHTQAEQIMNFVERLKTHISLPVNFHDERLSTVEAERLLAERGIDAQTRRKVGRRGRKQHARQEIDALAAAVILQDYLDQQHTQQQLTGSRQPENETE